MEPDSKERGILQTQSQERGVNLYMILLHDQWTLFWMRWNHEC